MIAVLITARAGSMRLAQKHLVVANHKPLLYWLIRRFESEFSKEIGQKKLCLAIATSEKPGNEIFSIATQGTSCTIIRGSDDNIPLRHLQCAKTLNADYIISVDGDDILCSAKAARAIFEKMIANESYDTFATSGLPLGMNVWGYSAAFLEKSLLGQKDKKLETGWGRIFVNAKQYTATLGNHDIMGDLRFTLDYQEDADFFCAVINKLGEKVVAISDEELITFVQKNELYKINAALKELYWSNYNQQKQNEQDEKK